MNAHFIVALVATIVISAGMVWAQQRAETIKTRRAWREMQRLEANAGRNR